MTTAATETATPRGRPRAPRPLVVLAVVGVLLVAAALLVASGRGRALPLDPDDAGPQGAKALVQVLAERGVPTRTVRSVPDLAAADPGVGTTVVVPGPQLLSASAVKALLAHPDITRLVLIAPHTEPLEALGVPVTPVTRTSDDLRAGCHGTPLGVEDTLGGGALAYRPDADGVITCFRTEDEPSGTPPRPAGGLLAVPGTPTRPPVVVVGDTDVFANGGITRASHADIALRLLQDSTRVVWFTPHPDPAETPLPSAVPDRPPWVGPVLLIGTAALVMLCLWRGRRLGPLVAEPLPVVVPANETTLARARLYRRAEDPDRVAGILRNAAMQDLRSTLRLPAGATPEQTATAVARVCPDEEADAVLMLLTRSVSGRELPDHARQLRRLRRKVRRT